MACLFNKQSTRLAFTKSNAYNLPMKDIAVLTGDLVASTAAEGQAVEGAIEALRTAAHILSAWLGHDTRFSRFRGDGWQLYVERPGMALRATLYLLARLRASEAGLATRLALALGPYDRLGETGLSGASGLVFEQSGHALDAMRSKERIAFDTPMFGAAPSELGPWQGAVVTLAHWQASRWSREQAEAIALALDPINPTQDQIAQSLGITRQAVQARLKGAGLAALQPALAAFEGMSP